MIYVVLRNGKVIQYNNGLAISTEDGSFAIRSSESRERSLIARLPLDVVERVEFERPCAVLREAPARKRKSY